MFYFYQRRNPTPCTVTETTYGKEKEFKKFSYEMSIHYPSDGFVLYTIRKVRVRLYSDTTRTG